MTSSVVSSALAFTLVVLICGSQLLFQPALLSDVDTETPLVSAAEYSGQQDEDPQQEDEKQDEKKGKTDRIKIPANDRNSGARRDFMRIKLLATQNILEGLTIGDFALIGKGVRQVEEVSESEKWVAIDDPKYRKLTADFREATKKLRDAVKTKNIEATALRFYNLSTNCIDCHKLIRTAEYEF